MVFYGFKVLPIVGVVVGLWALRLIKPGMLTWAFAWWVAVYALIKFGFAIPVPGSVITLYMAITTGAILSYVSSSRERFEETMRPIVRLATEPSHRLLLLAVMVLIPVLAAWNVYAKMNVPLEAPAFGRTVHPAPPTNITVHERDVDLVREVNPYRELKSTAPDQFAVHVENGRKIYFENCFYCHGDYMGGDGMFAHGLNPIPTNFTDNNVLPNFQESFFFWRIAKGAPGLPEEGGPWDSAMPAWENFLSEQEMWEVVLFLYEFTGYEPRAREEHH